MVPVLLIVTQAVFESPFLFKHPCSICVSMRLFAIIKSWRFSTLPTVLVDAQAINPIEMISEAVALVQKRFYEDYPPHPKEKEYNYKCSSTMKPTQMKVRSKKRAVGKTLWTNYCVLKAMRMASLVAKSE